MHIGIYNGLIQSQTLWYIECEMCVLYNIAKKNSTIFKYCTWYFRFLQPLYAATNNACILHDIMLLTVFILQKKNQ